MKDVGIISNLDEEIKAGASLPASSTFGTNADIAGQLNFLYVSSSSIPSGTVQVMYVTMKVAATAASGTSALDITDAELAAPITSAGVIFGVQDGTLTVP